MPFERTSGLLLHISSLPSWGGIGDLGPAAYDFANFLHSAGQGIWQVLPLNPVGYGNSPYAAISAMAGNPLLVSLEVLRDWGWLSEEQLSRSGLSGKAGAVDFDRVIGQKFPILREAAAAFLKSGTAEQTARFAQFCENAGWLEDYAEFVVLRQRFDNALWIEWPETLRRRDPEAMAEFREQFAHELAVEKVIQFAFEEQWNHLHAYCDKRGIRIMGDVAIFVSLDSADVWRHPELFELEADGSPARVAGVPPDYFSATGQRWGNPLYRWDTLEGTGFAWWVERMQRAAALYDITRLDHFRGFEAFWAIPGADETAVNGKWVKAPGMALFTRLREVMGELPFVAEDLGVITAEVDALRSQFAFPGMRILQFGFGNRGAHAYLPHAFESNTVVYTGTHDNDTTAGWWHSGATPAERNAVRDYVSIGEDGVVWALIRAASASVAGICLFPVQDILGLGSDARMNVPSAATGNWSWRVEQHLLTHELAEKLRRMTDGADRTAVAHQELEAERLKKEREAIQ